MDQRHAVLVVDDDPSIREMLAEYLSERDCTVFAAADCGQARELVAARPCGVVLLDIGLPGEDGLSFARYLRERHDIGIIILSGAGETIDRIIGLEIGADDYLAKPFDLRELHARLKSVARRYLRPVVSGVTAAQHTAPGSRRLSVGDCRLDLDRQQLFDAAGQEIAVTAMEFELLRVFAERPNRPLSRDTLLDLTQNREWDPFDRSIDIRIARLRRKIETDPEKPRIIRTVRGVGYMFCRPD
ncbi:MAG: response regulator [Gammaproteobacteria bacterium]|jgi:DNA-binding response OmpR family regulator|nr:response regulator [Gammaproteobacteria bacterium]MBK9466444.1 response regulator [Gammaproteobacteria bacterium]MBP6480381.1 response regulator [Pseudomonadales bacterium]MBP7909070.1 response regulator [Pseudomonadales bacterium]